jgi:hypothetical protein
MHTYPHLNYIPRNYIINQNNDDQTRCDKNHQQQQQQQNMNRQTL